MVLFYIRSICHGLLALQQETCPDTWQLSVNYFIPRPLSLHCSPQRIPDLKNASVYCNSNLHYDLFYAPNSKLQQQSSDDGGREGYHTCHVMGEDVA